MKSLVIAAALLLASLPAQAAKGPTPTPTPTAGVKKLAGGFGRTSDGAAEVTPAPDQPADQPLADFVRASRERARSERKATVAITNENLVTDPSKGRVTTSSLPTSSGAKEKPQQAKGKAQAGRSENPEEGEAYWRGKGRALRARLIKWTEAVEQLEGESKKLENDFYSWDDGQYRDNMIKPAWDRKREELEAARRELAEADKELAELPEKARKAGALPGWIREP